MELWIPAFTGMTAWGFAHASWDEAAATRSYRE